MSQVAEFYNQHPERQPQKRDFFVLLIVILVAAGLFMIWRVNAVSEELSQMEPVMVEIPERIEPEEPEEIVVPEKVFVPGKFTMDTLKTRGCVADGILNGYGGKKRQAREMIDRSNCFYLHRALENWLDPPDFKTAANRMAQFNKEGLVFGMFLSEAIRRGKDYENKDNGENFDFGKMCKDGTDERWGYKSCVSDMDSGEYRRYLGFITRQAMDIGIQSFLFGQIHLQDGHNYADSRLPSVIKDMRSYAKKKNLQIVIGAQTNSISEKKYLDMFDYIEGGVGIGNDGKIEDGPCWSRMGSCWALLWHDRWSDKAKNVLLHLDWSGVAFDDMSSFARLDKSEREEALRNLYKFFISKDMGFLMPFLAPLYPENKGCHGPTKNFYTPDNSFGCQDEDAINNIFSGG